jgi:hypothetical protein
MPPCWLLCGLSDKLNVSGRLYPPFAPAPMVQLMFVFGVLGMLCENVVARLR